jgi:hypothetical protein
MAAILIKALYLATKHENISKADASMDDASMAVMISYLQLKVALKAEGNFTRIAYVFKSSEIDAPSTMTHAWLYWLEKESQK